MRVGAVSWMSVCARALCFAPSLPLTLDIILDAVVNGLTLCPGAVGVTNLKAHRVNANGTGATAGIAFVARRVGRIGQVAPRQEEALLCSQFAQHMAARQLKILCAVASGHRVRHRVVGIQAQAGAEGVGHHVVVGLPQARDGGQGGGGEGGTIPTREAAGHSTLPRLQRILIILLARVRVVHKVGKEGAVAPGGVHNHVELGDGGGRDATVGFVVLLLRFAAKGHAGPGLRHQIA